MKNKLKIVALVPHDVCLYDIESTDSTRFGCRTLKDNAVPSHIYEKSNYIVNVRYNVTEDIINHDGIRIGCSSQMTENCDSIPSELLNDPKFYFLVSEIFADAYIRNHDDLIAQKLLVVDDPVYQLVQKDGKSEKIQVGATMLRFAKKFPHPSILEEKIRKGEAVDILFLKRTIEYWKKHFVDLKFHDQMMLVNLQSYLEKIHKDLKKSERNNYYE